MKSFLIAVLTFFCFSSNADLRETKSPYIIEDTLYIEGPIGSHIYDYISYEYRALKDVTKVSLNSLGGHHDWALDIAQKIKDYGWITLVEEGNFCASACVYLFGVGSERLIGETVWLGFHGARISGGYIITFRTLCSQENFENDLEFGSECDEFLVDMYETAMDSTSEALDLIESSGVGVELREYYFSLENDSDWYHYNNILKKPDWVINTEEAINLGLATDVIIN